MFQQINDFINKHYTNKHTHSNITRAFKIFNDNFKGDLNNSREVIEYSNSMNIHQKKALLSLMSVYHNKEISDYTNELKKTNQTVNAKTLDNKEEVPVITQEMKQKVLDMQDGYLKLIMILLIEYPALRLSDYTTIKIKGYKSKVDNYITKGCTKVVFNVFVKVQGKPITIKIRKEHRGLFKSIISNIKGNILTGKLNVEALKKQISRLNKSLGIPSGASIYRRTTYTDVPKEFKEVYARIQEIAKNQNHTIQTAIQSYM